MKVIDTFELKLLYPDLNHIPALKNLLKYYELANIPALEVMKSRPEKMAELLPSDNPVIRRTSFVRSLQFGWFLDEPTLSSTTLIRRKECH